MKQIKILLVAALFGLPGLVSAVDWSLVRGESKVKDNHTVLPLMIKVTSAAPKATTIRVTDYFQNLIAERSITGDVPLTLEVVTDEVGPYVKVALGDGKTVWDERIIFTDVLTGSRLQFSLNGAWQIAIGGFSPEMSGWKACELPYRWLTWQSDHIRTFRKKVEIPSEMKGKKIELNLSGVRFRAEVFVNGKSCDVRDTDQMPYSVDITKLLRPGEANELAITVTDWWSCVAPELQGGLWPTWSSAWLQGREISGMPFIRACTMGVGAAGISNPIFITATSPEVKIERVLLTTFVEKSEIQHKSTIRNYTSRVQRMNLVYTVFGKKMEFPVVLSPGKNEVVKTIPVAMANIELWMPWSPKLYRLRSALRSGEKVIDQLDTRFGFREFTCDGPVFKINGIPIRPNAAAGIPFDFPGLVNYNDASSVNKWHATKRFLTSFERINVNLLRYHTEPYPALMLDLADELGLMIVSEGLMSTLPGKLKMDDSRLWKNLKPFYEGWVLSEFNRPSVVIRSIENELGFHLPSADQPRSPWGYSDKVVNNIIKEMTEIGNMVKKLDPSRPIMYDGSGSVFYEVADIYNLHYPGIPGGSDLYPVTARCLSYPFDSYTAKNWRWDKKKPLIVGEYDSCFGEPKDFVSLTGQDIYRNGYLGIAHYAFWTRDVPGYRIDGMTSGVPWTILTFYDIGPELHESNWKLKLFKDLTNPLASFIHQYRECYYGNQKIFRTITTLNDSLKPQKLQLRLALEDAAGKVITEELIPITLDPATSKVTQLELTLPEVAVETRCVLSAQTLSNNQIVHRDNRTILVYPRLAQTQITLKSRWGILGDAAKIPARFGLKSATVLDANNLNLSDIEALMIIEPIPDIKSQAPVIADYLQRGGKIILLGSGATSDYLPFDLKVVSGSAPLQYNDEVDPKKTWTIPAPGSSMTAVHKTSIGHPALPELAPEELRYWSEGHLTAPYSYAISDDVLCTSLLSCGRALKQSVLIQTRWERGLVMALQLPVITAIADHPVASKLLGSLIIYMDKTPVIEAKGAVGVMVTPDNPMLTLLHSTGLNIKAISAYNLNELPSCAALIVDTAHATNLNSFGDTLKRYVKNGGCVWLYLPDNSTLDKLKGLLPCVVKLNDLKLTEPVRVSGSDIFTGVNSDMLFWPEGAFLPTASARLAVRSIQANGAVAIGTPAVAAVLPDGNGRWLIDEVVWSGEAREFGRARSYVQTILANLCAQNYASHKREVVMEPRLGYSTVSLTKWFNTPLIGGVWNGADSGLRNLPTGEAVFNGVPFKIIGTSENRNKSAVSFYSAGHNRDGVKKIAVSVNRKASALHFLVTSMWTGTLPNMEKLVSVDVEYTDNTTLSTDICYGRDLLDWCPPDLTATKTHPAVVWVGPEWPQPGLYDFQWINPEPAKTIKKLTLSSANDIGFAILLAITAQERLSDVQLKRSSWIPGLER